MLTQSLSTTTPTQTAKLFMNGRSQAVRLPLAYRFDGEEVYIRKDPTTGDVILSKKPNKTNDWETVFSAIAQLQEEDITGFLDQPKDSRQSQTPFSEF